MIAGFVDKSITTEPKQVAVWATAASSSNGTHPPGHPPAPTTTTIVRAQILFSNKLWFFPPIPKNINNPQPHIFLDSSGLAAVTPTWKVIFARKMMTICKLQHRPQNEHSGPSISQQSCSYFYMQIYLITYEPASRPEQAPHSFILSSKIMHPSLCRQFFHVSSKYAYPFAFDVSDFNCFLGFSLLF
jgi:hypothetical protein